MLYGDEREGQVVIPVGLMMPKNKPNIPHKIELALVENE
jgi:hypothetical protein